MWFRVVFWQRNARTCICEFDAGEDWRDVLEQKCPDWAVIAKVDCEEWFGVFEVGEPWDYSSWIEIPELE